MFVAKDIQPLRTYIPKKVDLLEYMNVEGKVDDFVKPPIYHVFCVISVTDQHPKVPGSQYKLFLNKAENKYSS